jgi:hypothetical protein
MKLEPYGKKGTFVGYNTSKVYMIYILGQCHIEANRDVTFDEEVAFRKSRKSHVEIDSEEQEAPKDKGTNTSSPIVHPSKYEEDSVEPVEPMDLPRYVTVTRKRPSWLRDTL